MRRVVGIAAAVLAGIILLAVVALFVFTGTGAGRNQAKRAALSALRKHVHGKVSIGKVEGNLLGRFSLIDVTITDSAGRPFFAADTVFASLDAPSLLSRRILLTDLALAHPVVQLARREGEPWNYRRIFPRDTTATRDTTPGFGDWIRLNDVRVRWGQLVVRTPWAPDSTSSPRSRARALQQAAAGSTRALVSRAPEGGWERLMEYRAIDGHLTDVVLATPGSDAMSLAVEELRLTALPLRPPAFEVRSAAGHVHITSDSVTIPDLSLRLPGSLVAGRVGYAIASGDAVLGLTARPVALADLRGFYPLLPDSGGGALDFDGVLRATGPSEYVVRNARLTLGAAGIRGAIGVTMRGDTLGFHDTELRLDRVPVRLMERLSGKKMGVPRGAYSGTLALRGALDDLRLDGAGTFAPADAAPFSVSAHGGLGVGPPVRLVALRVRAADVPVSMLREYAPRLPVGGTITAEATLDGALESGVSAPFTVTHVENGETSRLFGVGNVQPGTPARYEADVHLDPVSLALVRDFAPKASVHGVVTGTAHVEGTGKRALAHAQLVLPGGGTLVADGHADLRAASPAYDATLQLAGVDLHAASPPFPVTVLNGRVVVDGAGTDPATMVARVDARLLDLAVDSTSLQRVTLAASTRDGLLTIDSVQARAGFATASATGRLGLDRGHAGTLSYSVDVSDLAGFRRWIAVGDTGAVAVRPGIHQRLARLAEQRDSARTMEQQKSDIAMLAQNAAPKEVPATPTPEMPPLPRDSISGAIHVTGTAGGWLGNLTVTGTAATPGVVWGGNEIGRGRAEFTFAGVRTPDAALRAQVAVDSLRAAGFALDSTRVSGTWHAGQGEVTLAVFPGDTAAYRARADYVVHEQEGEVHLRDVSLRLDSLSWASSHSSTVRWRGHGLTIDSLELHATRGDGHILVDGEVPDVDPGNLRVDLDGLRVGPWLTLLQSDIPAEGVLSFSGRLTGPRADPRVQGALVLNGTQYGGSPFPEVRATFSYAAQRLTVDGSFRRASGYQLAHLTGSLPVDLSLGTPVRSRLPATPLALDIEGDSIPLSPLQEFTDAVRDVTGWAHGSFGLRGTWKEPRLTGGLTLDLPRVVVTSTGVAITEVHGRLQMSGQTLEVDSLVARSGGPLLVRGGIGLEHLLHPMLRLQVDAQGARVLNNDQGEVFADGRITLYGPLDTLAVTGSARITRGVVYLPEPEDVHLISTGDPQILAALDSLSAGELQLAEQSPIKRNLKVDVALTVDRGTWARSEEANVEVYGDVHVERDRQEQGLHLTGSLLTDQGEYVAYGKRFAVTRGSARFVGDPDIDPALQVTASYQVRQAGRAPFDIRIVLGGTMRRPSLTLESDAQPTLSQSDLISFLAFGQSSTSLLQFQTSGLQGGGQSGGSLAGSVGALATRQLAGVALGALVDEAKKDLVATTGADVVDITPADLPADLSLSSFGALARGTEIRLGKYTDRRTFVMAQLRPTLAIPGASIEHRFPHGFSARTSFETRYLPQQPSLSSGVPPRTLQVFAALFTWSLHW